MSVQLAFSRVHRKKAKKMKEKKEVKNAHKTISFNGLNDLSFLFESLFFRVYFLFFYFWAQFSFLVVEWCLMECLHKIWSG